MTALIRIKNLEFRIIHPSFGGKLLGVLLRSSKLVLFLILTALFLPNPAFAQTSTSSATTPTTNYQLPTTISPTSPLYTDLLVNNLFHTFSCLAIGQSVIGQPCLTYQMTKNAQGMLQGVPVLSQTNLSGGTLGAVTSVIGMLYTNPPVRTADYLASVGQGMGIVKEAKAQVGGSGAAVLNPILKLWQVSRNISYVILIIIFLIIGLMVMFRNKINPQTVITAQTALPGLVIGLVMITFSYFFAGLISDFAFIGTNLAGYYFSAAQGTPGQDLVEDLNTQNVLSVFSQFTGVLNQGNISQILDSIWHNLESPTRQPLNPFDFDPSRAITALAALLMVQMVMPFGNMFGPIGSFIAGGSAAAATAINPTGVVGFALAFIAMIVLLYSMFKLLLRLINNYLTVILLTFTAPFQLLIAALPGRQGMATNWMLNMLANILAFPAVLAVLYFVAFLLGPDYNKEHCINLPNAPCPFKISQSNPARDPSLMPVAYAQGATGNIVGSDTFPLFGGIDISFLRLILAFGALVALPSIPDILGRTIGKMSATGQLIGQEIGAGTGAGRQYMGQLQSGLGGFAGQVGRLTDEPGYMLEEKGWRKITHDDSILEQRLSGAKPGLGSRIRGFFRR